jgi:hypothetical protein
MEQLSKSAIFEKVRWALNHSENLEVEFILKNTGKQCAVHIIIEEQESYIDAEGIKWVRA